MLMAEYLSVREDEEEKRLETLSQTSGERFISIKKYSTSLLREESILMNEK